ncbi:MAG: [FeFe] hydrogenase H-cluster maturation GTPase HydF [Bacteroidetes bacterium]|nr:[FeFe] hydrogenase H-cluster maturation GTPase HydF [Bacteroidota bacterium]
MKRGKENKPHIGIFGKRNVGKSAIINSLTGQDIAIVSDYAGTTTDPVKKSIEIPQIGPCVLIDTAGIDDEGILGAARVKKTEQIVKQVDLAILVMTQNQFDQFEIQLLEIFSQHEIPVIIVHNKEDVEVLSDQLRKNLIDRGYATIIGYSAITHKNKSSFIQALKKSIPENVYIKPSLLGGILSYGDIVLLITPIDIEAPEGRIILPQVQAIRDILDNDCVAIVLKEREVDVFLQKTAIQPKLVITDSQVFTKADASIPKDVMLTSFSIMLAHYKGDFAAYLEGTPSISTLQNNDRVLLLESCTHHVSCDDIGRVKIPRWMSQFTGKKLHFDVVAGLNDLSRAIEDYALVVQCGGCMVTQKQLHNRLKSATDKKIPITNYGMAIAYLQGIYNRAIGPFVKNNAHIDYL